MLYVSRDPDFPYAARHVHLRASSYAESAEPSAADSLIVESTVSVLTRRAETLVVSIQNSRAVLAAVEAEIGVAVGRVGRGAPYRILSRRTMDTEGGAVRIVLATYLRQLPLVLVLLHARRQNERLYTVLSIALRALRQQTAAVVTPRSELAAAPPPPPSAHRLICAACGRVCGSEHIDGVAFLCGDCFRLMERPPTQPA